MRTNIVGKYERQLRSTRKEAIYLFDHVFPLPSPMHQGVLNQLRGIGFVAALLHGRPTDYSSGLGKVRNEGPAIKAVSRERCDVRRLDLLLVPVLLDGLGVVAGDVEGDLCGTV